jgi:hypothetical protein
MTLQAAAVASSPVFGVPQGSMSRTWTSSRSAPWVPTFGQAEGGHGWPAGWGGSGSVRLMSHGDRPVIVAMIPMWMMQVVVYQVVNVITVRNGLM